MGKTALKKEASNGEEKAKTAEKAEVLTERPAEIGRERSAPPDDLMVFRIVNRSQAAMFLPDIYRAHEKFIKKAGVKFEESISLLNHFTETCDQPSVLFLAALSRDIKCHGYLLASILDAPVIGVRELFIWHLCLLRSSKGLIEDGWKTIEAYARESSCTKIGGLTGFDPIVFGRWCSRFGLKKESTLFSKELRHAINH